MIGPSRPNGEAQLLKQAAALHQAGRLDDAERLYRKLLATNQKHVDAWTFLGVILLQRGRAAEAIRHLDLSLAILPAQPYALVKRGNALRELNRHQDALAAYAMALELQPNDVEAHHGSGVALKALSRFEDAVACYDKVLMLLPDSAEAYYNRGNALNELGRHSEALDDFDHALRRKPDFAHAHNNRGIALKELERFEDAIVSYNQALVLKPDFIEAYNNCGNALRSLKRYAEALAYFDKALATNHDSATAQYNRGNALRDLRRQQEAIAAYDQALTVDPKFAEAYNGRGNVLRDLKRFEEALASYNRAIALKPDYAEAFISSGNALQELRRYKAALASFRRALELKPDADYIFGGVVRMKMHLCDWEGIDADFATVLRKVGEGKPVAEPFSHLALPSTPAHQLQATRCYVSEHFAPSLMPLWSGTRYGHKRLRLGYFSADFHNHPTAHLIAGLFECHDRSAFEVVGFSWGRPAESAMRRRLEAGLDRLIDVHAMSDRQIAELVHDMEIDIAIDLMGHTQDARMGIFGYRPAPLQVGYLGYPGTTGSEHIDYIIADPTVVPEADRQYYSEKIVTLPYSYQPNDRKRAIAERKFSRAELGLPEQGFVFCCFNNNYKITPDVFDIWMRLLHAKGGSVLWLLEGNPNAAENLVREAEHRDISPERLVFAKKLALPEHLARHRAADLFLDTFHYNAHTTASDALWAGVPVVTRLGETFASRVAASLLRAAELPELVTESAEEYEALALELATDGKRLVAIKERLHHNRDTCPLFDTKRTTRHIETAFRRMSERQHANLAPDHIFITDNGNPQPPKTHRS